MDIREYREYSEDEVLPLYASVGWTSYTERPDMLRAAFAGSLLVLGAFERGTLVGLLRAVGDGASILYIQDVLVEPAHQRQGIGKALVQAALARFPTVYQTVPLTDYTPKTTAFYRACGLSPIKDIGCCAFMRVVS